MTDSAFDAELRLVVFDHVKRLRELHGGRIPRAELTKGIDFHGTRVPIWNPYQGIHKPAALGPDGAALSLQTSAESPYEDAHDPEAGHFIYKYRGTDPSQSNNVALRIAMREQRPLLYLVAVDPGVYDAIFPIFVVGDDPARLQFTLVADEYRIIRATQSPDLILAAARRGYVTRAVMQRLHQQHFRRLVLTAYSERCAICRLAHRELLDAAHILEDRDPRGEPLITNGVGLCKIHHSAYDANILGIDPDAQVHIRGDILVEKDGPMLKHGLQELHGSRLILPRRTEHRPNRDFLAERFDRFRAA